MSIIPFGLQTANSWSRDNVNNNFLYNDGSELNATSGLYDLPFRNYDATLGRFFQVDPLAHRDHDMTPYHYAGNNPIGFNDPTGLYKETDYSSISNGVPNWVKERYSQLEGMYGSFWAYDGGGGVGNGGAGGGGGMSDEDEDDKNKTRYGVDIDWAALRDGSYTFNFDDNGSLASASFDTGDLSSGIWSPETGFIGAADLLAGIRGEGMAVYVASQTVTLAGVNRRIIPDKADQKARLSLIKFIAYLRANSTETFIVGVNGYCATKIVYGLQAGGATSTKYKMYAKDDGPYLEDIGFRAVGRNVNLSTFQFKFGDIAIIEPPAGRVEGHIQGWDGGIWISDFKQAKDGSFWPGPSFDSHPNFTIYRYK